MARRRPVLCGVSESCVAVRLSAAAAAATVLRYRAVRAAFGGRPIVQRHTLFDAYACTIHCMVLRVRRSAARRFASHTIAWRPIHARDQRGSHARVWPRSELPFTRAAHTAMSMRTRTRPLVVCAVAAFRSPASARKANQRGPCTVDRRAVEPKAAFGHALTPPDCASSSGCIEPEYRIHSRVLLPIANRRPSRPRRGRPTPCRLSGRAPHRLATHASSLASTPLRRSAGRVVTSLPPLCILLMRAIVCLFRSAPIECLASSVVVGTSPTASLPSSVASA